MIRNSSKEMRPKSILKQSKSSSRDRNKHSSNRRGGIHYKSPHPRKQGFQQQIKFVNLGRRAGSSNNDEAANIKETLPKG